MNNINISLEDEIKKSEFSDAVKEEALKILNSITNGDSSDEKIKNQQLYKIKKKENKGDQE